jgi:RNA polymerase sigma-70 factor (ECF subfamily)
VEAAAVSRLLEVAGSDSKAKLAEPRIDINDLLAYEETVFLICLGFTRHYWDAQELAQETYLHAQQRLHQIRRPEAAKAWLFQLTRNICLDRLRSYKWKRWKRLLLLDQTRDHGHDQNPEALLGIREQLQQVKAAVGKLPVKLREVFVLNVYGELSYSQTAKVLDINVGTVMSRLSRARRMIKEEVGKGGLHD